MNINWVSVGSNVVMALIWIIYLHFFYRSYKRANRPIVVIHQARGDDLASVCMVVNMSQEPIHVQCVVAFVETTEGTKTHFITDYDRHSPEDGTADEALREGPVQPGGYLMLGSFQNMIERCIPAGAEHDDFLQSCESLTIGIAVSHGPSRHHIGARRKFFIKPNTGQMAKIRAYSIFTEQMTRFKKRKEVRHWVEQRLNPEHTSQRQSRDTEQTSS